MFSPAPRQGLCALEHRQRGGPEPGFEQGKMSCRIRQVECSCCVKAILDKGLQRGRIGARLSCVQLTSRASIVSDASRSALSLCMGEVVVS